MDENKTSAVEAPASTVIPPIGLRGTPLRYDLLCAADAHGPPHPSEPFVRLPGADASVRLYVSRLRADDAPAGEETAILIEPLSHEGGGRSSLSAAANVHRERIWEAGARAMLEIRSRGVASAARACVSDARTETSAEREAPVQEPLAYCRRVRRYIRPVCPSCLGPLATCRDETLLRRAGLPSYRGSGERFLHCAECARRGREVPVFYTWSERGAEAPADTAHLRFKGALYRDLSAKINGRPADPPADHPCFTCEHRTECYPAGTHSGAPLPAERHLVTVAYYPSVYLPVEPLPLTFEAAAALLGGATFERAVEGEDPAAWARFESGAAALEALSAPRPQFFFEGDPSGLLALEALYLKLAAFAQAARGVLDGMRQAKRPHLGLEPSKIRGRVSSSPPHVPARWAIELKISDFVSSAPLLPAAGEATAGDREIWSAPDPRPEPFLPAAMAGPQTIAKWARIDVASLEMQRAGDSFVLRLEADVTPEQYAPAEHGRDDFVRVSFESPLPDLRRIAFGGRRTRPAGNGFRFEGISRAFTQADAQAILAAAPAGSTSAEVAVVRSFSSPCDVTALGVLLLRLVLWNDTMQAERIGRALIEEALANLASPRSRAPRPAEIAGARWGELVAEFASRGIDLAPEAVLFRREDRAPAPGAAILFCEAVVLALRMGSNVAGFSVCERLDDYPEGRPEQPLERAIDEIEELAARARASLVGSGGRNVLVLQACTDFRTDLEEAAAVLGLQQQPGTDGTILARPRRRPEAKRTPVPAAGGAPREDSDERNR